MSIDNSKQVSNIKVMLKTGVDGTGIVSIEKTGSTGLVDTYSITLSDGRKTTFTVSNGKGITQIEKTSTAGLVDTYTITYNDGTTSTFEVANGNGIASISKTGSSGKVDTYTITYTNGTTSTFTVTNGSDTDVNIAEKVFSPAEKAYAVGDYVVFDNDLCVVTSPIAIGDSFVIGVNLHDTTVMDAVKETEEAFYTKTEVDNDFIKKSSTSGLVKNNGTIDTNSYATNSALTFGLNAKYPWSANDRMGAHQLLNITQGNYSGNGIVVTLSPDKSLVITGESTANTYIFITPDTDDNLFLDAGTYKLSWGGNKYDNLDIIILYRTANKQGTLAHLYSIQDEIDFTVPKTDDRGEPIISLKVQLEVSEYFDASWYSGNYARITPLIKTTEDDSNAFTPVAMTNAHLTKELLALKSAIANLS